MKIKQILLVFLLVAFVGCVPRAAIKPIDRIPFPEDEYKRLSLTGTAIVKGQGFLKTRGGDVKTAAGNEVILNPVTSYSNQWYEYYLKSIPIKEYDSRLNKYVKKQIADGDGRFTFKNVAAGDYYVTTLVYWEAAVGYQGALVRQGGYISKKITVKDGEEVEVIITR